MTFCGVIPEEAECSAVACLQLGLQWCSCSSASIPVQTEVHRPTALLVKWWSILPFFVQKVSVNTQSLGHLFLGTSVIKDNFLLKNCVSWLACHTFFMRASISVFSLWLCFLSDYCFLFFHLELLKPDLLAIVQIKPLHLVPSHTDNIALLLCVFWHFWMPWFPYSVLFLCQKLNSSCRESCLTIMPYFWTIWMKHLFVLQNKYNTGICWIAYSYSAVWSVCTSTFLSKSCSKSEARSKPFLACLAVYCRWKQKPLDCF